MKWFCRIVCVVGIVSPVRAQQCAGALSSAGQLVFDSLYLQFDASLELEKYEKRVGVAVDRLLMAPTPEADALAAALLQFTLPQSVELRVRAYDRGRNKTIVPDLKACKESAFKLPEKYRKSMRLPPAIRRMKYDEVIAEIEGRSPVTGLPREVESLVVPVLNTLKSRGDVFPPWWRILKAKTSASDESLVVLLDYISDAGYGQELTDEIVARGRRMLPLLERYQNRPSRLLADNYPVEMQRNPQERMEDFEWFIEVIKLGEVFDH